MCTLTLKTSPGAAFLERTNPADPARRDFQNLEHVAVAVLAKTSGIPYQSDPTTLSGLGWTEMNRVWSGPNNCRSVLHPSPFPPCVRLVFSEWLFQKANQPFFKNLSPNHPLWGIGSHGGLRPEWLNINGPLSWPTF